MTAGTLNITGTLNTPAAAVTVLGGSHLAAGGIVAKSLTIGGAGTMMAVPEPSGVALLLVGGFCAALGAAGVRLGRRHR